MASYPYEASEIERFTPASLAEIECPPVFRLRAASRRERRKYDRLLVEEGLRRHNKEAMRDEIISGLRALSDDEEFAHWEALLRQHWDAGDDWEKLNDGKPADEVEPFEVPGPSEEDISKVVRGVHENWHPLRKMAADNMVFSRDAPTVLISVILSGWSNLATRFSSHEGVIPLDTMDDLVKDLAKVEKDNGLPEGTAFVELYVAATNRLYLTKEAEKNSLSPPPSATDQQNTKPGAESEAGTLKASANSTETPAS